MRYISQHSNLALYNTDGTIEARFGPDGVLKKGTLTCDVGNHAIDTTDLMRVYDDDLDGNTVTVLEMCGLGSLNKTSQTGGSLTNVQDGWRLFYEAPPISAGTAVDANVERYKVLTGSVTYNGTTYTVNQTFDVVAGVTATTGSGTFAIELPSSLANELPDTSSALFDEAHLLEGDETYTEWGWNNMYGADPYDNLTSTEDDYIAWTR